MVTGRDLTIEEGGAEEDGVWHLDVEEVERVTEVVCEGSLRYPSRVRRWYLGVMELGMVRMGGVALSMPG